MPPISIKYSDQKTQQAAQSFFQEENIQPFNTDYQNRFLKTFITERDGFAERIIDIVQVDYFDSYQKILLNYEIELFNKYREIARFPALRDYIRIKEKGIIQESLIGLVDKLEQVPNENIKLIKDSSYHFFKERSIKNCLMDLVVDWKKHDFDTMKSKLETALKAGEPKNTGHDYHKDIEQRMEKDFRNPIPVLDKLDDKIGGGPAAGELLIVMASTGVGKSMLLVKMGASAICRGKKVVYYTLELSEKSTGHRFDACINQLLLKQVWEFPDVIREKAEEIKRIGGRLIIKEFPTSKATINTISAHLMQLEMNDGFIPDLIIVDYADKMKPITLYSEKRHTLTDLYDSLRGLAVEMRTPILTASQTNRLGINTDRVGLEMISEAMGKAEAADTIITIGIKDPEDKLLNPPMATLSVVKNRNGPTWTLRSIFDTKKIHIEIVDESPIEGKKRQYYPQNKKSAYAAVGTVDINIYSKEEENDNINSILGGK